MTHEELKRYKVLKKTFPFTDLLSIDEKEITDEYGVYSTGIFKYKGKDILISIDKGCWHLSVSANHTLGYFELKEIRYKFLPNNMNVAQIFPPRKEFVNIHENCFHLWQLKQEEYE